MFFLTPEVSEIVVVFTCIGQMFVVGYRSHSEAETIFVQNAQWTVACD